MRILFTQYGLKILGGSELYTIEMASELARWGHQVAVYTAESGPMVATLEKCGVEILDDPLKCPWKPDIIHGQHHEHALRAILAFPSTPAILYLHGFAPDLEKPFRHPRILRYLTIAESISQHWASTYALDSTFFLTIPNHIDLDRFHQKQSLLEKPSRALLYSNAQFSQEQLGILRDSCEKRGITLELAGLCKGSSGVLSMPEDVLPKYDVIFAVGRSALEAAACGCGVIPVYQDMTEEILLPETYKKLRSQNMAPRMSKHQKLTKEWVNAQLDRWNPHLIKEVTNMVRQSAGLHQNVLLLEQIYADVCQEYSRSVHSSWEDECAALEVIFSKKLQGQLQRRIESMEGSLSWKLTAPLRWIDRLLR